ncbi:hypothetical protein [Rubrimonas cliftonensis]|uniref:hypothetical protein n=1 Tax=Rubrimonas cliftonensis TaxID=89524 RepID=UPI000B874FE9
MICSTESFDADVVEGGAGDDRIILGPGRDRLILREGFDEDRVLDFRVGSDVLDFTEHIGVSSLQDLTVSQIGGSTVLLDRIGGRLVLTGIDEASLTSDVFMF